MLFDLGIFLWPVLLTVYSRYIGASLTYLSNALGFSDDLISLGHVGLLVTI